VIAKAGDTVKTERRHPAKPNDLKFIIVNLVIWELNIKTSKTHLTKAS
jgi:hypothetical protein